MVTGPVPLEDFIEKNLAISNRKKAERGDAKNAKPRYQDKHNTSQGSADNRPLASSTTAAPTTCVCHDDPAAAPTRTNNRGSSPIQAVKIDKAFRRIADKKFGRDTVINNILEDNDRTDFKRGPCWS